MSLTDRTVEMGSNGNQRQAFGPAGVSLRTWVLAVAVVSFGVYVHTLAHGFAYDDEAVVAGNRLIRSLGDALELFHRTEWSGSGVELRQYRPLTGFSFAINHAITGLAPWSYHLVNVLLHGAVSVCVLYLGLRWRLPLAAAGAGAVLFAVHPIHVEAVANVTGRKELLATLFLLVMALSHGWAARRPGIRAAVPVGAYAAAMLSKEVGIVGLALVAAQDVLVGAGAHGSTSGAAPAPTTEAPGLARLWRERRVLYGAYALTAAAYVVLFLWVTAGVEQPPFLRIENPAAAGPTTLRVLTAVAVLGKGLGLQFLPMRQSPDYSFDAIPAVTSAFDVRFLASAAAFVVWLIVSVRLARRVPAVPMTAAWYLLAILPVSNLLFPIGTIFGERLLYAPSVALALLAGAALEAVFRPARPWALPTVVAAIAGTLSVATVGYAAAWSDDARLFTLAARHQPRSAPVHVRLAGDALMARRFDEAIGQARRALEIAPDFSVASLILAEALRAQRRLPEARDALADALQRNPAYAGGLHAMGLVARDAGRLDEAANWWQRAIGANPRFAPSLEALAYLSLAQGQDAVGLSLLERAVSADPGLAQAWWNIAILRRARGDRAGLRDALARFVEVAGPEYAEQVAAARRELAAGRP